MRARLLEPAALFEPADAARGTAPGADKGHRAMRDGTRCLPLREVPHQLPQPATPSVGRERELDAIQAVPGRVRLLLLLGTGGRG